MPFDLVTIIGNSYRRAQTDGIGDETPTRLGDEFST